MGRANNINRIALKLSLVALLAGAVFLATTPSNSVFAQEGQAQDSALPGADTANTPADAGNADANPSDAAAADLGFSGGGDDGFVFGAGAPGVFSFGGLGGADSAAPRKTYVKHRGSRRRGRQNLKILGQSTLGARVYPPSGTLYTTYENSCVGKGLEYSLTTRICGCPNPEI